MYEQNLRAEGKWLAIVDSDGSYGASEFKWNGKAYQHIINPASLLSNKPPRAGRVEILIAQSLRMLPKGRAYEISTN